MTLSKYERETIIIYNQAEPNAMVYTHDPKLIAKLRRLHDAVPEKVYSDFDEPNGAARYIVPKSCVGIRPPYSMNEAFMRRLLFVCKGEVYGRKTTHQGAN